MHLRKAITQEQLESKMDEIHGVVDSRNKALKEEIALGIDR